MKNLYENVPGPGIEVMNAKSIKHHAIIQLVNLFVLKLNSFALMNFIKGFSLKIHSSLNVNVFDMKLYDKLVQLIFDVISLSNVIVDMNDHSFVVGSFTREELQQLVELIKLRMAHCEKERDERNEKFNPDTYIGMKLLLIELKELLLGEIVEIGSPILEPQEDRKNQD